jgi:serine/threonine-protein kinase
MSEITERLKVAIADRYVIERELGQGGMATVYLAHDVRHDRKVALKVLRPELAAVIGAERFLQEIKVTANLQHPNILALYDSGEAEGFLYYVMPFVSGESLRDKLDREKQLAVEEAIEITRGVAAALDYAHRQSVIHRDIKPENVLLHDGQPLVADFGIALAVSTAGGNRLTETGLSLGTPHYMSPEQSMGDREIDARSDIYSLGAMLYEMLAGEPPFTGPTAQAIVAKVITEKPTLVTTTRDTVPRHVAQAIYRALAKLPADRWPTAPAFSEALVRPGVADADSYGLPDDLPAPARWRRTPTVPALLALLALVGVAALWGWMRVPETPAPVRLSVTLPGFTPTSFGPSVTLSPDGTTLAYAAGGGGSWTFVVRRLAQLNTTTLSGSEGAYTPFFSPDGEHVGFLADQSTVKRVNITGGPPVTVADSAAGTGSWGTDGWIYFVHNDGGIARVPEDGGQVERLTEVDTATAEFGHAWPDVLPGNTGVVYTSARYPLAGARISVLDLATGESRDLLAGTYARYAESGHIVYTLADGALMAVPFDPDRLEVTGSPVSIVDDVPIRTFGGAEFTLAQNGTLLYGVGSTEVGIALVDRAGNEQLYPTTEPSVADPRVSPDGSRIVLEVQGATGNDVWVYHLRDSTMSRLTFEGFNIYPEWLPDGRTISFSRSDASPDRNLYTKPADGSAPATTIELPLSQVEGVWSPDGEWLVVRQGDRARGQNADLAALRIGSNEAPIEILTTPFPERSPALSPDGRWPVSGPRWPLAGVVGWWRRAPLGA